MSDDQSGAEGARLKARIDSGLTGEKAPGFDPAAAPLGTDAEAGGHRDVQAKADWFAKFPNVDAAPNGVTPEITPDAHPVKQSFIGPVVLGASAAIAIAAVLLFALAG